MDPTQLNSRNSEILTCSDLTLWHGFSEILSVIEIQVMRVKADALFCKLITLRKKEDLWKKWLWLKKPVLLVEMHHVCEDRRWGRKGCRTWSSSRTPFSKQTPMNISICKYVHVCICICIQSLFPIDLSLKLQICLIFLRWNWVKTFCVYLAIIRRRKVERKNLLKIRKQTFKLFRH